MVAWVVINRQHLPRAARGPSQPRKSLPIRALPLAARLFNNPTFKPANDPQFPPASIPILELTPPSSHRKSPPSFHALTWNPFCNPFVFIFMHVMGGYTLLEGSNLIVEANNPRRINRDGLERCLIRQAVSDGVRGVLSQPPREGIIEAGEGKFHAGSGKLRGLGKQTVIRIVL